MDSAVLVAVITVAGSIIGAAITFYLTKRHQLDAELRREKLNHYKVLLSALSDLAVDGTDKEDANKRFSLAVNAINRITESEVEEAALGWFSDLEFAFFTAHALVSADFSCRSCGPMSRLQHDSGC